MLSAKNLTKSFGDIQAVRGVSFRIARGEIFGLLGPNGAGKTTTIAMLTSLLAPSSGQVSIAGLEVDERSTAVKSKIGLVPQEMALYPTLSAYDNLLFFGRIYGLRGKLLKDRVAEVLEMVGLTNRAKNAIDTYSGGMKRRINIAAGLLHKPEILFLDEPTVGVDPQSRNSIFESVEALNKEGMTIVYTTHYMEEAERLCDRIAIMDYGKVIALDTPQELIRGVGGGLLRVGLHNGKIDLVAEKAGALAAAQAVSRHDGVLVVQAHQAQEALIGLLDIASRVDAQVTSLQVFEPNLETVFLQLTGKSLRD
ncbi:MAG: ATP-binding cassette domain-containing protein [Anaerolineae bacterium]|nr:ATP-binding cassette domain-containing protein [Anaerolineae bacterium]